MQNGNSPNRPNRQFSLSDYIKGFGSGKEKKESVIGQEVWLPNEAACYVLGTVSEQRDDGTLIVTAADGSTHAGSRFHARDARDENEADLVQMAHVDTPNILHTLRKRHSGGAVYTAVGQMGILISINP